MPKGIKNIKSLRRMAKPSKNNFLVFRIGMIAVAVAACAALGLSIVQAQTWSEPTLPPPQGNVAAPIWNQSAADQSASFRISGNGYVAGSIGIGTTSTTNPLEVTKNQNAATVLQIKNNSAGAAAEAKLAFVNDSTTAVYGLYSSGNSGYGAITAGSLYAYTHGTAGIIYMADTGPIKFAAGGMTENMRINNDGNVGIGLNNPAARLDIAGVTTGNAFKVSGGSAGYTGQNIYVNQYGTMAMTGRVDNANNGLFGAVGPSDTYGRLMFGFDTGTPFLGFGPGTTTRDVFIRRESGALAFTFGTTPAEKVRITSTGIVGIGTNNPGASYKLDVNGTVNAAGGAASGVLATSTGAYGVYGTGVTAGVGGISTAGYGVYGSSSGSYAGYFNGTLNATGDITQNGVKVCLADGTNCSVSSTSAVVPFRSTRATVAYNATLATKDAACVSEYGSGYQTATYADALTYFGKTLSYGFYDWIAGSGDSPSTVSLGYMTMGSYKFEHFTDLDTGYKKEGYRYSAVSSGTDNVLCVNKSAPLLRTRNTSVAYNATLATKDAECVSEFGSGYQTASYDDAMVHLGGSRPLYSTNFSSSYGFQSASEQFGYTIATNGQIEWHSQSQPNTYDKYGWQQTSASSGTNGVFCIKK